MMARRARVVLVVALTATAWAALLWLRGGFDAHLFGIAITTNDPKRPALVAVLAWIVFAFVNGVPRTLDAIRRSVARGSAATTAMTSRIDARFAAAALAVATFVLCAHYRFVAVGGSDSYGYASEADMWLSGALTVKVPWAKDVPWANALDTFTPLAWRARVAAGDMVPI